MWYHANTYNREIWLRIITIRVNAHHFESRLSIVTSPGLASSLQDLRQSKKRKKTEILTWNHCEWGKEEDAGEYRLASANSQWHVTSRRSMEQKRYWAWFVITEWATKKEMWGSEWSDPRLYFRPSAPIVQFTQRNTDTRSNPIWSSELWEMHMRYYECLESTTYTHV